MCINSFRPTHIHIINKYINFLKPKKKRGLGDWPILREDNLFLFPPALMTSATCSAHSPSPPQRLLLFLIPQRHYTHSLTQQAWLSRQPVSDCEFRLAHFKFKASKAGQHQGLHCQVQLCPGSDPGLVGTGETPSPSHTEALLLLLHAQPGMQSHTPDLWEPKAQQEKAVCKQIFRTFWAMLKLEVRPCGVRAHV